MATPRPQPLRPARGPSPDNMLRAAYSQVPEPILYTRALAPDTCKPEQQVSLGQAPNLGRGPPRGSCPGRGPNKQEGGAYTSCGISRTLVIICREQRSF